MELMLTIDPPPACTKRGATALASLTIHHWSDWRAGLAEVRRVAPGRQVVFTWAADAQSHYWFIDEYLPFVTEFDDAYPTAPEIAAALPGSRMIGLPVGKRSDPDAGSYSVGTIA